MDGDDNATHESHGGLAVVPTKVAGPSGRLWSPKPRFAGRAGERVRIVETYAIAYACISWPGEVTPPLLDDHRRAPGPAEVCIDTILHFEPEFVVGWRTRGRPLGVLAVRPSEQDVGKRQLGVVLLDVVSHLRHPEHKLDHAGTGQLDGSVDGTITAVHFRRNHPESR